MEEHLRRLTGGNDDGAEMARGRRRFIERLLDWSDGDVRVYRDGKMVNLSERREPNLEGANPLPVDSTASDL